MDAKTELKEVIYPDRPPTYETMRSAMYYSADKWLGKYQKGRSTEEIRKIIDDESAGDEAKGQASDIMYLHRFVKAPLISPNLEKFPDNKDFPLNSLNENGLTFIVSNSEGHPYHRAFLAEAEKRKLQRPLAEANHPVPRDLVQMIAYHEPTK